jgi:hypothetical protein
MNTATTKTRDPADPSTPSERDDVGRARKNDRSRKSSRLFMPLRWLRGKLSSAVGWVRAQIRSSARLIKSLIPAMTGKDRGFGFWWLVITAAIALTVGLLVAVLLSPVIGILAALIVGIWMLVRRGRSPQSRKAVSA